MKTNRPSPGFTLLELLVVMAIMVILFSLVSRAVASARKAGSMAREVNAARQLMGAYAAYSAAHDGELLPGYGNFPAEDERGNTVGSPLNSRYPWRLAPYFNYDMRILWGNSDDDQIARLANGDRDTYMYRVSVQPALGLNTVFVGGDYSTMDPTTPKAIQRYGQFCVTRISQASSPSRLIVFASAGGSYVDGKLTGYFKVSPPNFLSRNWARSYSDANSPDSYGNVAFRWSDKAVVAMLDGHVELLGFEALDDMRRWSSQAAELDRPQWILGDK